MGYKEVDTLGRLVPSRFVKRHAATIAAAANGRPILDVASGSGRNAIIFAELCCEVIGVDRTFQQFETRWSDYPARISDYVSVRELDLINDPWPFGKYIFGGIINVDFLLPALFPYFMYSLAPGGYLLLETVSGRGGNYLELPTAGAIRADLQNAFCFERYEERKVGPVDANSVAVKLLAKRILCGDDSTSLVE